MSDIYYMIIDNELHLTSDEEAGFRASTIKFDDIGRVWPWTGNVDITKVVFYGPIQLPPDSSHLFAGLYNLTTIEGLDNLDTSHVTNMSHMFDGCDSVTTIDLSGFDTSHVTDMSLMFYGCASLENLNLGSWDVSNVTDMTEMFYNCSSLASLNLSNWDVSNVTDMPDMFSDCNQLYQLNLDRWAVMPAANMAHMFDGCSAAIKVTTADSRIAKELGWAALVAQPPRTTQVPPTQPIASQQSLADTVEHLQADISALQNSLASLQQALSIPSKPQVR